MNFNERPWWARIMLGLGLIALIAFVLKAVGVSLTMCLQLFCYVVLIPLCVLACFSEVCGGLLDLALKSISWNFKSMREWVSDTVDEAVGTEGKKEAAVS
tara:strand:+ start:85 stop:384 length:300 start_codon:yes stop_codon:yes gene_type:complete